MVCPPPLVNALVARQKCFLHWNPINKSLASSLVIRAWNKSGQGSPMQKVKIISIEIRAIYVDIIILVSFPTIPEIL